MALREAHARGDLVRMSVLTHTMISSARTVGAPALAEAATHLNNAVAAREEFLWPSLIELLAVRHARVIAALHDHLLNP